MTYHDITPQYMGAIDRAATLRAATHTTHEGLDKAIMATRPFDNKLNYGRFLRVQHALHRDVAPLYENAVLQLAFPDLATRARLAQVTRDAADLDITLPDYANTPIACDAMDLPEALGWLYVIEGSNLGAAFLFKAALGMGLSAEFGAAHLAGAPEGRAAQWRSFKAGLNAVKLDDSEEARAVTGAESAFLRARMLVAEHLE